MNIIVSKYRGFCNGVTNAVNSAVKTLEENEKVPFSVTERWYIIKRLLKNLIGSA